MSAYRSLGDGAVSLGEHGTREAFPRLELHIPAMAEGTTQSLEDESDGRGLVGWYAGYCFKCKRRRRRRGQRRCWNGIRVREKGEERGTAKTRRSERSVCVPAFESGK